MLDDAKQALPKYDAFMDAGMREFWRSLSGPLPGNLRLYGGTALALYLNHRDSTDFDFVTPDAVIDLDFVGTLGSPLASDMSGVHGMVDAWIDIAHRRVRVTFMESGRLVPDPIKQPIMAANGIAVAHPLDLAATKLEASCSRGLARDYVDVAGMIEAWPELVRSALKVIEARNRDRTQVAMALANVPADVPNAAKRHIHNFARMIDAHAHGWGQ